MNYQNINFENLFAAYYQGTLAKRAPEIIYRKRHVALADLLQCYHDYGIVCPDEIDLRGPIDELLRCYGVTEMAVLSGFIDQSDDLPFWAEARAILSNSQIKHYYTFYQPNKLIQVLRMRLDKEHSEKCVADDLPSDFFARFLKLDRKFQKYLSKGYLLRLVEGFAIDGFCFADLIETIRKGTARTRYLATAQGRDILEDALEEFHLFMDFAFDLHKLLEQLDDVPLLKSEIWHYYKFPFGKMSTELNKAVNDILGEYMNSNRYGTLYRSSEEMNTDFDRSSSVISVLTNPENYAEGVDKLLNQVT